MLAKHEMITIQTYDQNEQLVNNKCQIYFAVVIREFCKHYFSHIRVTVKM